MVEVSQQRVREAAAEVVDVLEGRKPMSVSDALVLGKQLVRAIATGELVLAMPQQPKEPNGAEAGKKQQENGKDPKPPPAPPQLSRAARKAAARKH